MNRLIYLMVLGFLFLLAGCSGSLTVHEQSPAHIGSGRYDLKKSPCACVKYYDFKTGKWSLKTGL